MRSNNLKHLICTILVPIILFSFSIKSVFALNDLSPGSLEPPPQSKALDSRGVDMISGTVRIPGMRVSIGSGSSTLASEPGYKRYDHDNNVGTLNLIDIQQDYTGLAAAPSYLYNLPIGQYYRVDVAGITEILNATTGQSVSGDGGNINCSGNNCTYTSKHGLKAIFSLTIKIGHSEKINEKTVNRNIGSVINLTKPDGETLTYYYQKVVGFGGSRPRSVVSSLGWMLKYYYSDKTGMKSERSITAINLTKEYCSPTARTCSLNNNWPIAKIVGEAEHLYTTVDRKFSQYHDTSMVTQPGEYES